MTRCGVWLLLVLLAGCSLGQPSGDSPEAVCRRQAYDDPTVKRLIIEQMGMGGSNPQNQFDYEKALRDATDACLRKKGIAVRGGVEPVRPY
jgi:hypothetical protein